MSETSLMLPPRFLNRAQYQPGGGNGERDESHEIQFPENIQEILDELELNLYSLDTIIEAGLFDETKKARDLASDVIQSTITPLQRQLIKEVRRTQLAAIRSGGGQLTQNQLLYVEAFNKATSEYCGQILEKYQAIDDANDVTGAGKETTEPPRSERQNPSPGAQQPPSEPPPPNEGSGASASGAESRDGGRQEIDPADLWNSFVRVTYPDLLSTSEPNPSSPEIVRKVCDRLFSEYVEYESSYLWTSPLDTKVVSREKNFLAAELFTKHQKVTYGQVIEKIPIPAIAIEFKKWIDLISETISTGPQWYAVLSEQPVPGSYDKFGDFFRGHLPTGDDWSVLQSLPKIEIERNRPSKTTFGEQVFHSVRYYSTWNRRYVYANQAEQSTALSTLDAEIRSGRVHVPTPDELVSILKAEDQILRTKRLGTILPKRIVAGSEIKTPDLGSSEYLNDITLGDVLDVIRLSSPSNTQDNQTIEERSRLMYKEFVSNYKQMIIEEIVKEMENKNQKQFGLFPLAEFGLKNRDEMGRKREEVAISIGCQMLGLGEYEPNIRDNYPHAGQLKYAVIDDQGVESVDYRELSEEERTMALEKGKPAELIGFDWYLRTCSHMFDDDVSAKAAITFQRVAITGVYRKNYRNSRAELDGKYRAGIRKIGNLMPRPLSYLGTGGISLQKLLTRPNDYLVRDLEVIGDQSGGQVRKYNELWEWAVKMYKAISTGSSSIMGKNILQVGSIKTSKTIVAGVQDLEVDTKAVGELATFATKVIGYWIGNLIYDGNVFSDVDLTYWQQLKSPVDPNVTTEVYSPIVGMLNLHPNELHDLVVEVRSSSNQKSTFSSYISKMFLQTCIIEDLLRSSKDTIDPEDYVTLCWVLTGSVSKWATAKFSIKDQQNPFVSTTGNIFKFSEADVAQMCIEAGLQLPLEIIEGLREAGGITGA